MIVLEMARHVAEVAGKILQREVPIQLPEGSQPSLEVPYQILSGRLAALGFSPGNNIMRELEGLIHFCRLHFAKQ